VRGEVWSCVVKVESRFGYGSGIEDASRNLFIYRKAKGEASKDGVTRKMLGKGVR
jgi:hypothetical protein